MSVSRITLLLVTLSLALLTPLSIQAQASRPSVETPAGWTAPKTSWGDPDLEGIWTNGTITPLQRPDNFANKEFLTEAEARAIENNAAANNADVRGATPQQDVGTAYNAFWYDRGSTVVPTLRTSMIIDPANGRLPDLTPAAQERRRNRLGGRPAVPEGPEDRSLAERCIVWPNAGPPMVPSFYNNNYQILQGPGYVAILVEMIHDVRIVPIRGEHVSGNVTQWLGDAIGHWEGNTLVVETANFKPDTAYQGTTEKMKLTERFTRVNNEALMYEFTVDDPDTFVQPWTAQIPMTPAEGAIYEYACHEGNYAMEGMLRGAREAEAAAQQ